MKKLKTLLILWVFLMIIFYVADKYFDVDILNTKGQVAFLKEKFKPKNNVEKQPEQIAPEFNYTHENPVY